MPLVSQEGYLKEQAGSCDALTARGASLQLLAKCCREWRRDRHSLTVMVADMKTTVAGSAQDFQELTGALQKDDILCLWLKRFWQSWYHCLHVASLGTASGFWQALLQEGSSLSTTFTTPFWEALPFSHLLFVINITQKISRHERKHLLEKGWRAEPSAERMLFCMEIK